MELITAEVKLRPASYADLVHWEDGIKTTLSKQQFFVSMPDGKLECYTLEQYSDKKLVVQLIDEGRVYVLCGSSLVHAVDGVITGRELIEVAA